MLTKIFIARLVIYLVNPIYIKIILTIIKRNPKMDTDNLTSVVVFIMALSGISLTGLGYFGIGLNTFDELFLLVSQGSLTLYVCTLNTYNEKKKEKGGK